MANFADWNDENASAAAECAVRLMKDENYDYDGAIKEASERYSADCRSVAGWFKINAQRSR